MTRDYSQFLPLTGAQKPAAQTRSSLDRLGWTPFFAQQINIDDLTKTPPVRVVEVHRNGLHALGDGHETLIPPGPNATVGDWLLWDKDHPRNSVVLNRKSLFKRRAPGTNRKVQLIAANIDTAFIVTSCNQDFNVARLERYVALAFEADVMPVIVITKTDLCSDIAPYMNAASEISIRVGVVALNALGQDPRDILKTWCGFGQTVAFLGSSGVGKSTLVNALMGDHTAQTSGIREDDAKGRHTTTRRQFHFLANGCAVLDTPGMRELQLIEAKEGIADLFHDIAELTQRCRFNDCTHQSEPGCAVLNAVNNGGITQTRLKRWRKLVAEERFNSTSVAERKAVDKSLQKRIRAIQKNNRK